MASLGYIVNVEAAILKDGQYLIITRSEKESHAPGILSLPGGKVECEQHANNILEQTIHREIKEETGIEVEDVMEYLESTGFMADDGEPVINIVFLCRYKRGVPTAMNADEVADIRWMTASEIFQHEKTPLWLRQSIQCIEKKLSSGE